jgi:hypothetical protein
MESVSTWRPATARYSEGRISNSPALITSPVTWPPDTSARCVDCITA